MKRILTILLFVAVLSGCAALSGILDILADDPKTPKPAPVCDVDTVGVHHQGQVCLKYDDGKYRWGAAK
jgi:hypothetical protein